MNIPDQLQQDVISCLNGGATAEQKADVKRWLKESKSNFKEYEELSRWYFRAQYSNLYNQIDVDKAKFSVISSVKFHERRKRLLKWSTVAASLLVMLSLTYFARHLNTEAYENLSAINTEDMSPYKKAVLTLSDGKEVFISDKAEINLRDQTAEVKQLVKDGIQYSASKSETSANEEGKLTFHTLRVPRGGEFKTTLIDGTQIWLNAQSEIRYPVVFTGNTREVYLKGEAFFEVAHDADKPFIVHTSSLTTKVLGTSFNISAYDEDSSARITLEQGSVKVNGNGQELILEPGWQASLNVRNQLISQKVKVSHFSSWRDGKLSFHRMPLEQITSNLQRWYDVEFEFEDEKLKDLQFSGGVHKTRPIGFILKLIEETTNVKFNIKEHTIKVEKDR
ncbi:MAG: FecR domain-containing protein [Carboxylicivirga sp.]|jgi:ferric-dicitrate binding protein FerR (iron transport regulator)|nr:FecR domain-containing protein [Carboxylicivirga sp.]